MLKLSPLSSLLLLSGITAAAGFACSSGGIEEGPKVQPAPTAGTGPSTAGTGNSPGTSGASSTAGTSTTGGSGGGQAGSPTAGGMGGSSAGGTGGTGTGGSGGTGTAGSGGSGGSGGGEVVPTKLCSETANAVGEPCFLFDGTQASVNLWGGVFGGDVKWELNTADKTLKVKTGTFDIKSKPKFQDLFVHVEYMTPKITSAGGGQERGNSGIYLKSSWEVQVLDTFGLAPTDDGCGAIYEVRAPTVSACKKEEEWNVYEIEFKAQVCTNGQQTTPANMVSVKLNDILVQENVPLPATATRAGENPPTCGPNGLLLQDHSSILPVTFRNIWVIPRSN